MYFYAAPMEGITGYIWRNAHHHYYPGIVKYYTPFLSPGKKTGWTSREKAEILPDHNHRIPLVPQVLTNSAEAMICSAELLHDLGYREVNLNLGCPSGTVVSKGKGSGFLKDPDKLKAFFDKFFEYRLQRNITIELSVKTRLGMEDPEEILTLMKIYNQFPLSEIVLHARVQKDLYKKPARRDIFRQALRACRHPVCYNGDIFTLEDESRFEKEIPEVTRIMLGRGIIANPQLQEMIVNGTDRDMGRLRLFHDEICTGYENIMSGDRNVLFKMKELWSYLLWEFPGSEKTGRRIKKCTRLSEYKMIVDQWFSEAQPGRYCREDFD